MNWSPIQPPGARPPAGAYSPAIRAGHYIFISGQVPVDVRTGAIIGDDVVTQTDAVLDRIELLLQAGGASLRDVVSVTAYLADIGDWDEFNRVYGQRFEAPYPTRTTVGAQLHGFLVEISAIAYVGGASGREG
ncbi:MAG TPA: Rid family hydrolase [Longimicrobiales bacterium]